MRKLSYSLIIASSLLFLGCKDKGPAQSDFINIFSPTEGQSFSQGDTLSIQASAQTESGDELHGYEVHVTDQTTDTEVFSAEEHTHVLFDSIQQSFVIDVSNTQLKIQVIAILDHDGSTAQRSVVVNVE